MKKITLTIEETLKYRSEVTLEVPDSMTEDELNQILDKVENKCSSDTAKDVAYVLNKDHDFEISKASYSFPDSPSEQELEIIDFMEAK